jgi:hypothetical protein
MKLVILNGATSAHLTNPKATMHVNHKALTPLYTNKLTLVLRRESALSDSLTRRQSCTFIGKSCSTKHAAKGRHIHRYELRAVLRAVRYEGHENPGEKGKYLRLPEIKPNTTLSQADIDGGHCGVANVINKKGIALQASQ